MSILSRLFGGKREEAAPTVEAEEYEGFRIYPEPIREGSIYRVCARIEKEVEGETRTHTLVRADTMPSLEEAMTASIRKAKQMIDEQGVRLFN